MTGRRIHPKSSRVLVLGLAFKENCPDLRNSKVADLVKELQKYGADVDVWDPWVSAREAHHEYGIRPIRKPARGRYDAVVVAVGHRQFRELDVSAVRRFAKRNHVLYDIKYVFGRQETDGRL
jgi:UDP-N-acetyl-D-galactosamine dehydrogenase